MLTLEYNPLLFGESYLKYQPIFLHGQIVIENVVWNKVVGAGNPYAIENPSAYYKDFTFTYNDKIIGCKNNRPIFKFILYFSLLGLGFMLIEVSLIQKFILFLGKPTLALSVLLFSLLIASGIGSLYSDHFDKKDLIRKVKVISMLIGIVVIFYVIVLSYIFNQFLGHNIMIRSIISAILLFPLGFLIGIPFPTGIKIFKQIFEEDVPLMWGINGAMSVLGSVLAVVIAILFGFTWALLLGAIGYFGISANLVSR